MTKYILYFIGYIIAAFIYIVSFCAILDARGYRGDDIGIVFVFAFVFVAPVIIGYFVVKKLHYMRTNDDRTFIKSWTLQEYIKDNNVTMQVGEFQTFWGKRYHKCIFTQNNGKQIFVKFFYSLVELSVNEISKRKTSLRIGLTVSKELYLYDDNESVDSWETVSL